MLSGAYVKTAIRPFVREATLYQIKTTRYAFISSVSRVRKRPLVRTVKRAVSAPPTEESNQSSKLIPRGEDAKTAHRPAGRQVELRGSGRGGRTVRCKEPTLPGDVSQ